MSSQQQLETEVKDSGELWLNLSHTTILQFQGYVYDTVVESMRAGIAHGDTFPPVPVHRVRENIYALIDDPNPFTETPEGGHHRSYAHLLEQTPLRVKVIDGEPVAYSFEDLDDLGMITVREDRSGSILREKRLRDPRFR